MVSKSLSVFIVGFCLALTPAARSAPADYFAIHIVDDQTGRGVPLVRLQTTDKARYYTDSNGYVAFNEPGLMNQDVYFAIASWGYEAPNAGFGNRGAVLHTVAGRETEIKIHRINIAERLYRLTGQGIYRDTVLLGKTPPIEQPLLNGKIMGSDTVETAIYRGKMYWFWGDADCPFYPLGNFSTTGATTKLPADLQLDRGIDYTYFTDPKNGFARAMISVQSKESLPVWIDGLMVVPDSQGQSRLLARFVRTNSALVTVEQGLALFDDQQQKFQQLSTFPVNTRLGPGDHPMRARDGEQEYYFFPRPYATVRVKADYAHATDPSAYEGFTCLSDGTPSEHPQVNRDANKKLVWAWKQGATPIGLTEFNSLVKAGVAMADESPYQMFDKEHGKSIRVAGGSIAWNPWLKKWTMLFGQLGGDSNLGEIWFAIANSPLGPWTNAKKVATHAMKNDNNDFYNPMQHPKFMQEGGRIIYFEGTFVTTFSGNPAPTPRYDYNQIMYRIDLSDPRMVLPEPPAGLSKTQPSFLGN